MYIAFYIYCSACLVKSFRPIIPDHLQLSPSKSLIILYPTCLYGLARYVYVCVHQNPLTCFGASLNGFSAITVSVRFHCTVPELLKVPCQFSGQQEGHLGSETQYSPLTSLKLKTSSDISCAYQPAFMVCYW